MKSCTKFLPQEQDGERVPTDQFITVSEWKATKFCVDPATLHDYTKYFAFKQITPITKQWICTTSFSFI
jgi:hypothetical protein